MEGRRPDSLGFGTRALSAASRAPRVEQRPDTVPIYQTVTFSARDAAELGDILSDRQQGYAYSRIDNPTSVALADAIAELEGAQAASAFATGIAAVHAALLSTLAAGDHAVAARALYGSTQKLFERTLPRFGVTTALVDASDLAAVEAAFTPHTRLLYVETIANPTIDVADIAALAAIAHARGALLIVDNTFASPYLCRPIELGADLVVESCTKWLAGHSDVLGGVIAGGRALVEAVRQTQIDTGGSLAPFSAFLILRGLATLHVRLDHSSHSALALARHLEQQEGVRSVHYPGLAGHAQYALAQRQLRSGGGMLAVDFGERDAAAAFIEALQLTPLTATLGSVRTICMHPPSTSHRELDDTGLARAGIRQGIVRVSVGLEDLDDLIADFERGLSAARSVLAAHPA